MQREFIITIVILIIGFAVILWYLKKGREVKKDSQSTMMMQEQLKEIRQSMLTQQAEAQKQMQKQFGQSAQIIKDVTTHLTKLDETNKQVIGFAEQLQSLENILKNPKQRGILGEYFLETVLKNVLPPGQYQMQYKFENGEIVDAVIFTREGIVPIDSKFSLENYNKIVEEKDENIRVQLEKQFKQDLKNRIDETSKYIRPNERTTEFAFMFIPSEAIYYDLLVNQIGAVKVNTRDLIEYALRERRVIIVSPTTFFAYLQTVLHGLRALKIEESTKEIRKYVENLGKHIKAYDDYLRKLGIHLSTTVNTYNTAYKEFGKIDKDILKISEGKTGKAIDIIEIDKPKSEE